MAALDGEIVQEDEELAFSDYTDKQKKSFRYIY